MVEVADADFQSLLDRARGELRGVTQQVAAMRQTELALKDTLEVTQSQIAAAQTKLADLQATARDTEMRSAKLLNDARAQAGAISVRAARDAKKLIDDAKAKVAAAARLLTETKDTAA